MADERRTGAGVAGGWIAGALALAWMLPQWNLLAHFSDEGVPRWALNFKPLADGSFERWQNLGSGAL